MKPYHHLTIVRNRYRARELAAFRDLVEVYFQESQRDGDDPSMGWDGAQAVRSRINQMLPRIIQVVRAAGLDGSASHMTTDPGPTLGRVDVLQRIFSARYTDGAEQEVLDVLDMAIGVYDGDRHMALGRTFSPFHYVGTALSFLVRGPLKALGLRRSSRPRGLASDVARLEAVAARLSDVETLIDSRLAIIQERQSTRLAENARQLSELAERLDFAERVLAQPQLLDRLAAPEKSDIVTPV